MSIFNFLKERQIDVCFTIVMCGACLIFPTEFYQKVDNSGFCRLIAKTQIVRCDKHTTSITVFNFYIFTQLYSASCLFTEYNVWCVSTIVAATLFYLGRCVQGGSPRVWYVSRASDSGQAGWKTARPEWITSNWATI